MKSRELRERRGKLAADMAELAKNLTAENLVKFNLMDVEQEELRVKIEAIEKAEKLEEETRTGKPPESPIPGGKPGAETYASAFSNYLKYGMDPRPEKGIIGVSAEDRALLVPQRRNVQLDDREQRMLNQEFRDMGTGGLGAYPGSTTGFFVPVGFVDKVVEAQKYYGNMVNEASVMTTATGQVLPYPTDNDTAQTGELVGEGQQVTTADVTLGQIIFNAWKFSTKMVKISIELLQDSAFDFDSFLVKKFATRTGRTLNTYFTNGTGINQPNGYLTATITGGLIVIATGASANDGGAETGGTTLGSDDFINLEHAIDPLYRNGSKYMMHDSTLRTVKKIKDKYGRPLWQPGLMDKAPDTINGYQFSINNDMPVIALNAKTVTFGPLDMYMIRRVKEMSVLRLEERFADFGQVAFLGFSRLDGNLLDAGTHPSACLQMAAA